ncbi:3-dehydroquinate synthase [Evansella cellulosilytica DSM 2522]|uniref:3-dehydroquinate synthase n=2 Tax=Evansella TaxID=2837485 RepID=E6TZG2_EVAC2|nr:3-dehydroquinate synthase [Evansella cellulosilytica DSM 2522]
MNGAKLQVKATSHEYPIIIECGCHKQVFKKINEYVDMKPSAYFIITDELVSHHYLTAVKASFPNTIPLYTYVITPGEQSKSFCSYEEVMTAALQNKLDRKSMIIALGGGVVGDLAGFVAATYMRGVPFVQIPTTLLAHDSSVGGKVGINHELGKNMVGAFHAPSLVLYDPECLLTLPEKEWRSGFAEVIKHGFIADPSFLNWLEGNISSFSNWDMNILTKLLRDSIAVKARIVEEDEKEKGIRAFLNFGHTLGHAIEAELGYGNMSHGEAVVIGMLFAFKLSEEYYGNELNYDRYFSKLVNLGYDLNIPKTLTAERLLERMKVDKKAHSQSIHFVLLKEIGEPELVKINEKDLYDLLQREVSK